MSTTPDRNFIDAILGPDDEVLYRAEPVIVCAECEPEEEPPIEALVPEHL